MNQKEEKYKIVNHCDCCNFNAHSQTEWNNHLTTKKHERKGKKIADDLKCDKCGLVCYNSYNFKIHMVIVHGSSEEKKLKSKFYCECCDVGFFCKLYFDKHNLSKKHIKLSNTNTNMQIDNMVAKDDNPITKEDKFT